MKTRLCTAAALALLVPALAATPLEAQCQDVIYRIWQKDGGNTYHDFGDEIVLEAGKAYALYLHYRSQASLPYGTSAEIGYPGDLGVKGYRPLEIVRHVKMKQQTQEDKNNGVVNFTTVEPGDAALGYRLTGLRHPGDFNKVPEACRTGVVRIKVAAAPAVEPSPGAPANARQAAEQMVARLFEAILRRDTVSQYPEVMVTTILSGGFAGIVQVAGDTASSDEFRTQALERTRQAHEDLRGRLASRETLETQLLNDIYDSLYARKGVRQNDYQLHLENLHTCLSATRDRLRACQALGRYLVEHPLFSESHADLLTRIAPVR